MPELAPGMLRAVFVKLAAEGEARGRVALEPVALAIERQAKINASTGEHRYRTKTPAYPGSGPARISGTLVRSITHSPVVRTALGWETKVGLAPGLYPHYSRRTPSSKYGYYLEIKGLRNGNRYPFLVPAFKFGVTTVAHTIFRQVYGAHWRIV